MNNFSHAKYLFVFRYLLALICLSFLIPAYAEPWGTPTFPIWKKIFISEILEVSPLAFDESVPGSVQKKPQPQIKPVPMCNQKQPGGYYLPVPCKETEKNDRG